MQRTRQRLLQAAFQEVYTSGFRSANVDAILEAAQVTKGALYYYFVSKDALGHAIIDEIIAEMTRNKWLVPLQTSDDPIGALIQAVQSTSLMPEHVSGGCPLNNLAQEMSSVDEAFRMQIAEVFREWTSGIAKELRRGQKSGLVRSDVDAVETATFIVAVYEGYISLAKNLQDASVLRSGIRNITGYLESLRAPGSHDAGGTDPVPQAHIFSLP